MWHSREAPDLARDGNRERELKSVFPMSVTLCRSESECACECVRACVLEWENAGLFLIGCCTLDPFSSLGVALLSDLDGFGWRKYSLIDVLSTQTRSAWNEDPRPPPLLSYGQHWNAPFLRLAVMKPSEREKERLCRGKQDERIWREKRWHAPPSPCFKWQAREKPDIWRKPEESLRTSSGDNGEWM